MFHVADLRAAAQPALWTPSTRAPIEELLKRARGRRHATGVQGIADLWLVDDLPDKDQPSAALTASCGVDTERIAAAGGALLDPHGCLPGPMDPHTRERDYYLIAPATVGGGHVLSIVKVRQRSGKKPKQRLMVDFVVHQVDLDDEPTALAVMEDLFMRVDQADKFISGHGRPAAPIALLIGCPAAGDAPTGWRAQLAAASAVRGYNFHALTEASLMYTVPDEAARRQPELVLSVDTGIPSLKVIDRVAERVPDAQVVHLDAYSWSDIRTQARDRLREVEVRQRAATRKPRTVGAAIDEVCNAGLPDGVVVLKQARKRAHESPYVRPTDATAGLRAIGTFVKSWRSGLDGTIESLFADLGMDYAGFVSATAHQQYRIEYTIRWEGKQVLMGPHLRWGGGGDVHTLRIYWYADKVTKTAVVGHIGRHLPGAD